MIHRNNLAAALINGSIGHKAQYSQVHPFLCHDGRAPQDFQIPRTVDSMRILDSKIADTFSLLDQTSTDYQTLNWTASCRHTDFHWIFALCIAAPILGRVSAAAVSDRGS